jgi:hypothetical protein
MEPLRPKRQHIPAPYLEAVMIYTRDEVKRRGKDKLTRDIIQDVLSRFSKEPHTFSATSLKNWYQRSPGQERLKNGRKKYFEDKTDRDVLRGAIELGASMNAVQTPKVVNKMVRILVLSKSLESYDHRWRKCYFNQRTSATQKQLQLT